MPEGAGGPEFLREPIIQINLEGTAGIADISCLKCCVLSCVDTNPKSFISLSVISLAEIFCHATIIINTITPDNSVIISA